MAGVDDIIDLPMPEDGYGRLRAEAGKSLDETLGRVGEFSAGKVDSDVERLLGVIGRQVEALASTGSLGFDDSRLQAFVGDDVLASAVADIDVQVAEAERLAAEQAQQARKQWEEEHPLEMFLQAVTDVVGSWWDGVVDRSRALGCLCGFRDVLLVAGLVGRVASGLAFGSVGVARLGVDVAVGAVSWGLGLERPGWVDRDFRQFNGTVGAFGCVEDGG